jgi:MFS family permease
VPGLPTLTDESVPSNLAVSFLSSAVLFVPVLKISACFWLVGSLQALAVALSLVGGSHRSLKIELTDNAVVVPMYQGEISTAETRGAMMCVTGIMYAFGYSLAGWLGFGCYFISGESPHAQAAWRFPLAMQCLPPLIVLAGSNFIPYSPRWLLSQGRRDEALDVVKRLHHTSDDKDDVAARQEFYLIEKQFELDAQQTMRRFEIFRSKSGRKRALVAAIMMWGDQFLGIFVLTNYGVLIYASLGFKGYVPLLLNACWTTFTIIGNSWTALFIDRFGRRTFLLIGSSGIVVSLVFLCALTARYLGTTNTAALNAAVFFIWFFIFWWSFFIDATQYVYVAEIWPNHLRSQGTAWGLAFFYLASEITLVAAPPALDKIGWRFYLVLIVPSVCYIVAIYFLFPETKGRTLEEIGSLFGDEHVASHWYGLSEEAKAEIAREALSATEKDKSLTHEGGAGEKEMLHGRHIEDVGTSA